MRTPASSDILSYCSFFISTFANCLLIFLLITEDRLLLGSYKKLMMIFAFASISYTFSDFLYRPAAIANDGGYVVLSTGPLAFSPILGRHAGAYFCMNYGNTLIMIALHYIYRYFSVCRAKLVKLFDGYKIHIWLFPVVVLNILWYVGIFFLFDSIPDIDEYVGDEILDVYETDISNVSHLAVLYFYEVDGERVVNINGTIMLGFIVITQTITLVVIVFCGHQTYRALKVRTVSSEVSKLQRKLFKMLVVQTGSPILLMYFSLSILTFPPLFGYHIGKYAILISYCIGIYPATEPIIILYFIGQFRQTIMGWLGRRSTDNQATKTGSRMTSHLNA